MALYENLTKQFLNLQISSLEHVSIYPGANELPRKIGDKFPSILKLMKEEVVVDQIEDATTSIDITLDSLDVDSEIKIDDEYTTMSIDESVIEEPQIININEIISSAKSFGNDKLSIFDLGMKYGISLKRNKSVKNMINDLKISLEEMNAE